MAFPTDTAHKVSRYLGFPASGDSLAMIEASLALIQGIGNATYIAGVEAAIAAYLSALATLDAAILAEAQVEGSTLLPELRREYRRHCALVAIALALPILADTAGASQA